MLADFQNPFTVAFRFKFATNGLPTIPETCNYYTLHNPSNVNFVIVQAQQMQMHAILTQQPDQFMGHILTFFVIVIEKR